MDWHQGTTTDREGITRENKHFQVSSCGRYIVCGGRSGDTFCYHAFVKSHKPVPGALYRSGSAPWWCIAVTNDPDSAKRACT